MLGHSAGDESSDQIPCNNAADPHQVSAMQSNVPFE